MRKKAAQNLLKLSSFVLAFIVIFGNAFSFNKIHAAPITSLAITGTGISSNSSASNTPITPTISFALPSGLTTGETLTLVFRGVVASNDIFQNEITFAGGCSGTSTLGTNPIVSGTANPIFSITGITCSTSNATMSIAAGNLTTLATVSTYQIELVTPNDYGVVYFFVGGGNQVLITAQVNAQINIKVYPEKRIPGTGNWQNQNLIEIRNVGSTTPLVSQIVNMDANGDGTLNSVDSNLVGTGSYDIAIKGYSHLRKVYTVSLGQTVENLNLTGPGNELLAGDTSVVEDNYINSLDLSQIAIYLYSTNTKNDLNRDGEVNSLDMSNMSYNLYLAGQD